MPDKKALLSWSRLSPFILPVVVLTGFLVRGYDPYRACLYSIVIAVLLYLTIDFSPAGWANRIKDLMAALEKGVDSLLSFMSLIVLCSVLVGVLTLTGITPKITGTILVIAGHNLFAALVFGAVATLFLGMGLPTPAAYIVGASVIAPSLIQLGIKPITAHLFVLYYAVISNLTPPVCIAAVVASIIADADWFKASLSAMKLGVIGYLVPFLMVYRSTFIMEGSAGSILFTVVTALIGILFLSAGFFGYLKTKLSVGSRLFLIPSGFFFILPTFAASLVGAGLGALSFAIIWFHDWRRQGKAAA